MVGAYAYLLMWYGLGAIISIIVFRDARKLGRRFGIVTLEQYVEFSYRAFSNHTHACGEYAVKVARLLLSQFYFAD